MGQLTIRKILTDKIKNIKQVCYISWVLVRINFSFFYEAEKNVSKIKRRTIQEFKKLDSDGSSHFFLKSIIWCHFLLVSCW